MKKMAMIFFSFFSLDSVTHSQVYQEWVSIYSSPGIYDFVYNIASDDSGNVYISGSIRNPGSDFATIKYNPTGDQQWIATYDGAYDDGVADMFIDDFSNIYVTGSSYNLKTDNDYLTIKYNSTGVQQWVVRYNDTSGIQLGPKFYNDQASDIGVDGSGNVYVAGTSGMVKYNSSGNQVWVVKDNIYINDITLDLSGNIYVTGFSDTSSTGNRDCATIKYNSSGIKQWTSRYGTVNTDESANSITVDACENVYVTGIIENNLESDYLTLKYNSIGIIQWASRYSGSSADDDISNSIHVGSSGNVFVSGSINRGAPWFLWNYGILKYNSSGVLLWISEYNGTGNWADEATGMVVDSMENVYVTGYGSGIASHEDYETVKYDSSGVQQWAIRYEGPAGNNDEAYAITIDKLNNIYVTGVSAPNGNLEFTTVKYSQMITQASSLSSERLLSYRLHQNFPNPFNPTTKINYSLPNTQYTILKVYDVLGKEIATLVNEKQNAGSYSVEFNAANYPSGIYYYKLEAGEFSEVKKMILLK